MTSFPAQRLGLSNRGLLRDGFKADLVVFDPVRVGAPATRSQPRQLAVGIDYVLVNGHLVIDAGQPTGVLMGRALRRGRP
jgi:N-acyl-D-amino-acid deacylase